jgi:hypothetical protein
MPEPVLGLNTPKLTEIDTTGSASSFSRISRWLEFCAKNHPGCRAFDTQCWAPTRLLDVGTESCPTLKLHITQKNQRDKGQRFISLSHRWGSENVKKLLQENIAAFWSGIKEQELSQTFKDAFQISRRLGVPFIWIL